MSSGLDQLLGESANESESISAVTALMDSINSSFLSIRNENAELRVQLRVCSNRIATLETFVSYLIEKDPAFASRVKAMGEAMQKEKVGEA